MEVLTGSNFPPKTRCLVRRFPNFFFTFFLFFVFVCLFVCLFVCFFFVFGGGGTDGYTQIRVCYIENLDLTNLRKNNQNVRQIEGWLNFFSVV